MKRIRLTPLAVHPNLPDTRVGLLIFYDLDVPNEPRQWAACYTVTSADTIDTAVQKIEEAALSLDQWLETA